MRAFDPDDFAIIYSPHMKDFAEKVYDSLPFHTTYTTADDIPFKEIILDYFNSGESHPTIPTNVRERHVYVLHCFTDDHGNYDPDKGWMNLYLIDDALHRSSAEKVTYILPHIPYQRQDRMDKPRTSISAKRSLEMLFTRSEMRRSIATFDMHAAQIQGFVDCPFDHLYPASMFAEHYKNLPDAKDLVVVSPDVGGAHRARQLAKKINNTDIVLIDKRRRGPGQVEEMKLVGDVKGRPCLIYDDIFDTGGTSLKCADLIMDEGASVVYACGTHPILSQDKKTPGITTEDKIRKSGLKIMLTDSIPRTREYYEKNKDWLTIKSVAPKVSEAMYVIQTRGSISTIMNS